MRCLRANNKIAASIHGRCSLEKPLDPCVAKYSVTRRTRRETCGSICKAILGGMVGNEHGSHIGKQVCIWQDKEKS